MSAEPATEQFHVLRFDAVGDLAAFVAALSRFVASPRGQACRAEDSPIEVWADCRPEAECFEALLSDGAVHATSIGFGAPPVAARRGRGEFSSASMLMIGDADRASYGSDDIVRRMTESSIH